MTHLKDFAWVALIVLCLPLIMAAALVAVVIIVARSLYLWARGNVSSTSRPGQPRDVPDAT